MEKNETEFFHEYEKYFNISKQGNLSHVYADVVNRLMIIHLVISLDK